MLISYRAIAVVLLFLKPSAVSCVASGFVHCADVAGRGRLDCSGNCPGLSCPRTDHGTTHQPGEANYQRFRNSLSNAEHRRATRRLPICTVSGCSPRLSRLGTGGQSRAKTSLCPLSFCHAQMPTVSDNCQRKKSSRDPSKPLTSRHNRDILLPVRFYDHRLKPSAFSGYMYTRPRGGLSAILTYRITEGLPVTRWEPSFVRIEAPLLEI